MRLSAAPPADPRGPHGATGPSIAGLPSSTFGAWRSPVAHLLWEQGVVGSNPTAPTGRKGGRRRTEGSSRAACPACGDPAALPRDERASPQATAAPSDRPDWHEARPDAENLASGLRESGAWVHFFTFRLSVCRLESPRHRRTDSDGRRRPPHRRPAHAPWSRCSARKVDTRGAIGPRHARQSHPARPPPQCWT